MRRDMPTIPNALIGCAGEHFVAYRLSVLGYVAALTRSGSPYVDLMVGTIDGRASVTIQVKTARSAFLAPKRKPEETCWYWHVGRKARDLRGDSVFYAFVDLKVSSGELSKSSETPDIFVVPADFVADHLNAYPKSSKNPTDFWFDIGIKDKNKWFEAWRLIIDRLETCNV